MMQGDFSRITFDPRKHYSGVRMQQGRVQLDADWNEQADILAHRIATETRDLVGESGAPEGSPGFRIVPRHALEFDGRDDYVALERAGYLPLDGRRPFTLEAWVEPSADGAGGTLLSAPGGTRLAVEPDGTVSFHVARPAAAPDANTLPAAGDPSPAASIATVQPPGLGRRMHLAAVWDGSAGLIYVDGRPVECGTAGAEADAAAERPALGAHLVGHSASRCFAGRLEELRVWSVARAEAEIRADREHTPTGREPGLAGCWVFHDGQGDRVPDLTGGSGVAHLGGGTEAARPRWVFREIRIGRGRYYVEGALCENEEEIPFHAQPDLPGVSLPTGSGRWLVYLDVWERLVTAHQDPSLREVALGGPDTTARTRTVWQVRLLDAGSRDDPGEALSSWRERIGAPGGEGRLAARREPGPTAGGNYLFRVEIHCGGGGYGWPRPAGESAAVTEILQDGAQLRVGSGAGGGEGWQTGQLVEVFSDRTDAAQRAGDLAVVAAVAEDGATLTLDTPARGLVLADHPRVRAVAGFKWSRDNGSVAFGLRHLDPRSGLAEVYDLGQDAFALEPGDWVEVADDGYLLGGRPAPLRRVSEIDRERRQVTLDLACGPLPSDLGQDVTRHPLLRRWDQGRENGSGLRQGILPVPTERWTELEDGVQVRFSGGRFRTGDYWTLPVRSVGRSGIDWPPGEDGPLPLPPQGPPHRHAPLAWLRVAGEHARVEDLRTVFAPLSALGGDYVHRTGPQNMEGPLTIRRRLAVGEELTVAGSAWIEGELSATLAPDTVGTPQLADRSVTYRKLAGDVGLLPPGAIIFGETPYPPEGYEWTGGHLAIPLDDPAWRSLPPLPHAQTGRVQCVAFAGEVYLFSDWVHEVWRYAPALGAWEPVTLVPGHRHGSAVGVLDGRIYLVGGMDHSGRPLNRVDAYDPAADRWELLRPLPTPRSLAGVGVAGGRLYAIGGRRHTILGSLPTARNEAYDPASDRWAECRAMGTRRGRPGVAVVQGHVHVLGGDALDELGRRLSPAHEAYDPVADRWRRRRRMPTRRAGHAAAVVSGKIYVLGGEAPSGLTALVEEYDPSTNGWSERAPLPTPRRNLGAAGIGGRIFAVGGEEGGGYTDRHEELPLVAAYYPYRKVFWEEELEL
ncbi:MAG TPA: DUF6519 domain-containing protein [Longimicrobiaceae bacterium]|nr:DUF6519 domain-containing protein [Longimicrobiaceae bacterium]